MNRIRTAALSILVICAGIGAFFGCQSPPQPSERALLAASGAPQNLPSLPAARCVITALPGAYTGNGTGTLTASSGWGPIAAQNGVTLVAGDIAFLAPGATNETHDGGATSYVDEGPYVVVSVGTAGDAASNYYQLTRPSWWAHGSTIPIGSFITIGGEDTLFGGSKWTVYAAKGSVVDTNDPIMYPDQVGTQVTLASGVKAITTVPLRSATKTVVIPTLEATGGSVDASATYVPLVITPGYLGTATVTVKGVKGVTTNVNDTSTLNVLIKN
jgi:hypothetical protein